MPKEDQAQFSDKSSLTKNMKRPLTKAYPFLIVDAIYVKARDSGSVKSKGLLVAIGVNEDGHREVLGFKAGDGESYEIWFSFFSELKEQGLRGVDLVTSDQHKGLFRQSESSLGGILATLSNSFLQEYSGQGAQEDTKRGQASSEGY